MRGCETTAAGAEQLFFAGCRQERGPKPVGFWCPGGADSLQKFPRFIRRQSDRKDNSGTFRGKSRPAHFLFHANSVFRLRKCLTRFWTFVYKCPVSNFETLLSPKEMAGTAAGESELTSSQPVCAGASQRESEMNTDMFQAGNSGRRFLKIETTGDFYYGKIKPRIRLTGKWLERAGFKPGHRVEVRFDQPGSLTLRFVEQAKGGAL